MEEETRVFPLIPLVNLLSLSPKRECPFKSFFHHCFISHCCRSISCATVLIMFRAFHKLKYSRNYVLILDVFSCVQQYMTVKPKLILVLTLTFGLNFSPYNSYSMALVLFASIMCEISLKICD